MKEPEGPGEPRVLGMWAFVHRATLETMGETSTPAVDAQILAETPDRAGAFPRLEDEQIAELIPDGFRRFHKAGEVLYREGDPTCDFVVILSGKVKIVEGFGSDAERVISVHGPGRFLGELNLLTGQTVFVTAVVAEPGEVLAVPVDRLREVVTRKPGIGDLILRAYLLRRSWLIGLGTGLKIIGSRYSPDTRRIRQFGTPPPRRCCGRSGSVPRRRRW